jgi:4-aminobutyrate aminotransferase-like enzyme
VSHYKFKKLKKEEYVSVVPMAMYMNSEASNFAKGRVTNSAEDRSSKSDELREVENFAKANFAKTVFIHESLPSCAGQLVPDEDFFMDMYAEVKRQGGVCIADEVQTGLGRVGSHYWAFELFTIAPDIVTIGKPLGNGHPIAAVVCTRAIAESFAKGPEFFSSFGGNPVSCAIASAVLDVIEKAQLQTHAFSLGNFWLEQLRQLQREHPVIGDVRGHGLFLGIEFVDPVTGIPSKKHGDYVVKRMLDHRILTSLDGPGQNVMKIKPPMSMGEEEVELFLQTLKRCLSESFMR